MAPRSAESLGGRFYFDQDSNNRKVFECPPNGSPALLRGLLTICCLLPLPSSAQQLSFGLKGGYSLTDSENKTGSFLISEGGTIGSYDSSRRTYLVGGTVEVSLPFGLSLEGDFLYRPYNLRLTFTGLGGVGTFVQAGNSNVFEIPVMAKLRLGRGLARPFVTGGPDFRINQISLSNAGVTVGGGLELKAALVKISPELRYTRWGGSGPPGVNPNQAAVLLGITF